uniref:Immunoglobulin V-set domain-containing protein n=1 Tax=Myripristis murdjan TaxID=586833 RepID=A0A667WJW9_9TELE
MATYSEQFGTQVNGPFQGKVVFSEASFSSTSITLKNVTWTDEACYICSFNAYPDGSKGQQICLTVQGTA